MFGLTDELYEQLREVKADLRESERYSRDLECIVAELEPGARLTAIRQADPRDRTGPLCDRCWGKKTAATVKRMTPDPEDDIVVEITCPKCKGSGLPPQWVIDMCNGVTPR